MQANVFQETNPEEIGPAGLRAFVMRGAIDQALADAVMAEATQSNCLQPGRPNAAVVQDFSTLVTDHTRQHEMTCTEELGSLLREKVASEVLAAGYPAALHFDVDESVHQVYPSGSTGGLGLGWHRDNVRDLYLTMSAHLGGAEGHIDFAEEIAANREDTTVVHTITTRPLDVVVFACTGLYTVKSARSRNINRPHRVRVGRGAPRHTVQFRKGVNAAQYGNIAANADAPLRDAA